METIFIYNGVNVVSYKKLENGQYKLTSEHGTIYIVYKEEIQDNL